MNENKEFEKFIHDLHMIKMSDQEKNKMSQNLELFAQSYEIKPSPYQKYFPIMKTAFAFVLFFAISLPLSKPLSRDAIPGEALYLVKIIHEEITAASIGKADKKIDFEIERTEKRIQEAVILAEKSELDPIKQVEIANEIKEQVKSISEKIKDIKKENPEKALSLNSELITTLEVNSDALKEITKTKKKVKVKKKKKEISEDQNTEIKEENLEVNKEEIPKETDLEEEIIEDEKQNSEIIETGVDTEEENLEVNKEEIPKETDLEEEIIEDEKQNSEIIETGVDTEEENLEVNKEEIPKETDLEEEIIEEIEEVVEEVVIESSLASIIIDALETETEKAEKVDTEIKEKITEELDQKQEEEEETPEEIVIKEESAQDTETTEVQETEVKPKESETSNLEIPKVEIISAEKILPSLTQNKEILKEEIKEIPKEQILEELSTAENTIQGEIEKEISALEKVALAEANLNQLLFELAKEKNPESNLKLKELKDSEQFGKALIFIQEEINILQAEKIEKGLKTDFGIDLNQAKNEIIKE